MNYLYTIIGIILALIIVSNPWREEVNKTREFPRQIYFTDEPIHSSDGMITVYPQTPGFCGETPEFGEGQTEEYCYFTTTQGVYQYNSSTRYATYLGKSCERNRSGVAIGSDCFSEDRGFLPKGQ